MNKADTSENEGFYCENCGHFCFLHRDIIFMTINLPPTKKGIIMIIDYYCTLFIYLGIYIGIYNKEIATIVHTKKLQRNSK